MLLLVFPLCATATATLDCAPGLLFNYFVNVYCFFFIIFLRSLCFFFLLDLKKRSNCSQSSWALGLYRHGTYIVLAFIFITTFFYAFVFFSSLFIPIDFMLNNVAFQFDLLWSVYFCYFLFY